MLIGFVQGYEELKWGISKLNPLCNGPIKMLLCGASVLNYSRHEPWSRFMNENLVIKLFYSGYFQCFSKYHLVNMFLFFPKRLPLVSGKQTISYEYHTSQSYERNAIKSVVYYRGTACTSNDLFMPEGSRRTYS